MVQFWREHGIAMLKEAISLPGLAFKFEMSFLKEQGLHLSSFHTEDLYKFVKDNMVGPAIIFHRYAEKDKSTIRECQYGEAAKPVQTIIESRARQNWCHTSRGGVPTSGCPGWGAASPPCTRVSMKERSA